MTSALQSALIELCAGRSLSFGATVDVFDTIMEGKATQAQIGAFLIALRIRGESADDLVAAATALRNRALTIKAPDSAMDIVGTGGDRSGSYNVSTAAALIVAGCGVPVAKHGNRSATSKSGTADTLQVLGVKIDLHPDGVQRCLDEAGICFMLAPTFHAAMRQVAPVRTELGTPTIFNLTGPLCNPAGVKTMLAGVYDGKWVAPYAQALDRLGVSRAWVVHGLDGLDELTTTGPSSVMTLDHGTIKSFTVTPADAGLEITNRADLIGGDAHHNAAALMRLLSGEAGAYRTIAVFNAAAALVANGQAGTLFDGARIAERSLDSGAARTALEKLIAASNS
jgi:anthranilate phosphoribosyltransferase